MRQHQGRVQRNGLPESAAKEGRQEIIVGGAGIIGLSVSLELAMAGFSVRVIERGQAMSEASWAAAGMLAAQDPGNPAALRELALLSQSLYPDFLHLVERLSRRRVPLHTQFALHLRSRSEASQSGTVTSHAAMNAEEAKRRIPGLKAGSHRIVWLQEMSLDPRDLTIALPLAATRAGVAIEEENEIIAVTGRKEGVVITTSRGLRNAGTFINCCGAWSSSILGVLLAEAAVEPVKGQMLAVCLEKTDSLPYVVRGSSVYLVPRNDGRIVIGSTVERVGFDRSLNPVVADHLLREAAKVWPPIAKAQVIEHWAGFRPGTRDELPLIGRTPPPHCWVATGHCFNGILLAPGTAQVMRLLIEGHEPGIDLSPFQPSRSRFGSLPTAAARAFQTSAELNG